MRRRMYIAVMALCGATSATSLQTRVWMQSRSPELWGCDVNGCSETDFIQSFRMTRATFSYNVCDSWLRTVR